MSFVVLFIAVCFLAYANGANDNFKGVASLYGSGSASYRSALAWATITTVAGSICALYWAEELLIKFTGKGLAPDALIQTLPYITAVALGAGMTVIIATHLGFPISTTHALLGALAGSTLMANHGDINLSALGSHFVLPLLLSPVAALLLAIGVYALLKLVRKHMAVEEPLCLCVEERPGSASIQACEAASMALSPNPAPALRLDRQSNCRKTYSGMLFGFEIQRIFDVFHFASAGSVCFARGLNDTPKIAALMLLIPEMPRSSMIVVVAAAMAAGGLVNAGRVAETMSHRITTMTHGQGLSANLTTAFLVIFASKLGLPVSTTHVSVGSLFGIGLLTGQHNRNMVLSILLSWLLTLPCAAVCAAGIYSMF